MLGFGLLQTQSLAFAQLLHVPAEVLHAANDGGAALLNIALGFLLLAPRLCRSDFHDPGRMQLDSTLAIRRKLYNIPHPQSHLLDHRWRQGELIAFPEA